MFVIETCRWANGNYTRWLGVAYASTLEQARKDIADNILAQNNREDRGEVYEREWEALAERAKTAEIGEEFEFEHDARKWRITEDKD